VEGESDAESAFSIETVSAASSHESDSSTDNEGGGRITSKKGIEIDRQSAGYVKLTHAEKIQRTEQEDEYGYTLQKIKKKYSTQHEFFSIQY
jgi:hypothetical protein